MTEGVVTESEIQEIVNGKSPKKGETKKSKQAEQLKPPANKDSKIITIGETAKTDEPVAAVSTGKDNTIFSLAAPVSNRNSGNISSL